MVCDVAIVGYGPVGMIAAALLAQRGLKVIVVERYPTRYALGRAGHFDGETFRTFQRLAIAEEMELLTLPMLQWQLVTAEKELLATVKLGESGAGWKSSYLSYQPEFEVVFDAKVRELGVRIFMGLTAVELKQDAHSGSHAAARPTGSTNFFSIGWKIISWHPVPTSLFNDRQLDLISRLRIETAHVSRGATAHYRVLMVSTIFGIARQSRKRSLSGLITMCSVQCRTWMTCRSFWTNWLGT